MIYLRTFKLDTNENKYKNMYPYSVLGPKDPDVFVFDNITVLYGNNGSGKSTVLNIIAHKLGLKGKEPVMWAKKDYFSEYVGKCKYELNNYIKAVPEKSRYIKSEELLYEVRKVEQDSVLKEAIERNLIRERGLDETQKYLSSKEGQRQFENFKFSLDKYSNGETAMQILEDSIEPDKLYLLDEPEVSLSPSNQVKMAEHINKMARYLDNQFIIATHSPFLLGILNAKIYNLDTKECRVQKWSELENVRFFYDFFQKRKSEFEV